MKIKLIVWDLDDTLWQGTLADGDAVRLHEERAELIRAFNARGIVSSICSKNDFDPARAELERLGLWDEFVFPHIAFEPKPEAVAGIIEDMQLRPVNVLFVDDNPLNLNAVKHRLPEINILDIRDPGADTFLAGLLAAQQGPARNRVEEYRTLERKTRDRQAAEGSNEDFLRSCEIKACAPYLMDCLDFTGRIEELINRSNQLNYTNSRVTREALERDIIDVVAHDSWAIFAWDRYGDYGLVGFVMVDRKAKSFTHFTFSCRAMHMGLEEYALGKVREKHGRIDMGPLKGRFSRTFPDWIEDRPFHDPEVRAALIARAGPQVAADVQLRIAFDCQSGGIAHFSRWRDRIDFDNNPRLFALRQVVDDSHLAQDWPPQLVYGAGIDYSNPRWPDLADLLEQGLYEACVAKMCAFIAERGIRALIVLPPADAPEALYRPQMAHTRARTELFNAIWRDFAAACEGITLLDLSDFAEPHEMSDVSHYHAGLLMRIAGRIDDWYGVVPVQQRFAASA